MEEIKYPIRINKYLAQKNICSRKEADDLIKQGKVKVNGKAAVLGYMVKEDDQLTFGKFDKKLVYFAFNKPKGIVTTNPSHGEVAIKDIIRTQERVFPIGRLDKDSHGLIILTNDGRITGKVLDPELKHEKEYTVKTNQQIDGVFLRKMATGVKLDDGYITKNCVVNSTSNNSFSIVLIEGKNRQIRRMCTALGKEVRDLQRTRILNISLGDLKDGQMRKIEGEELNKLLSVIGLKV